ncbi:MAG: DUF1799 domain-containing protein [Paracoccus sp. (in: a-proteobacteria)]|uniref:DUF1799 domain-containing protein n=1 Tax=Paracoccus sp. TaxID=267 RepID=UPI0026E07EFC|nr:DUF1799 domain-containing protein [Paracoccus sp. (in: a-proteobacteria)]MDO5614453.1 DUF1799 domain-containing protein [Paracoccus sp. (in: a-proteobacteria)]
MRGDLFTDAAPSEADTDAARWGLPAVPRRAAPPPDDGIWPAHIDALAAFLAVANQWRCHVYPDGSTHWLGLDYTAAASGLTLAGITPTPDLWDQIRSIEDGAAQELNKRGQ